MLDLSTMAKNYSHCPLKKRPIQFLEEEKPQVDENVEKHLDARKRICVRTPPPVKIEICDEEPENLCTKDRKQEVSVIKHVAPIVPIPVTPTIEAPVALRLHNHQGAFHRVQPPVRSELQNYAPTTWCRSVGTVAPTYPPAYMPLYYPNQEIYQPYPLYPSPPSPYAPRDSSCSPPTYRASEPRMPELSLSPTSSNESPADLSSPPPPSTTSSTSSRSQRHQCPDCGKSYSTFSGLSKHRQFHCAASNDGPRKSFSCKYCEKVYVSLGALKMHIRTHTLPCKCTLCGKAFSRPWLLQGHIRTHTGEKPFSCQHCHRAFADRSNLRAHLQTHSDIKKYSCPTCSKTFSRMSLLTKHAETGGCCSQPQPQPILYQPQKQEYFY